MGRLCEEARQFGFVSVCINPCWVSFAAESLAGSTVRVCTVIGFPLGANALSTKLAEAELALAEGAQELDMVQNIGALRSGDFELVKKEIAGLSEIAHPHGAVLKVILETCLLSEEEKIAACRLALEGRADFVKTSSGFSTGGATASDVKLMRRIVGEAAGVKAAGGIHTLDNLLLMLDAGANRIGTSAGVNIIRELETGKRSGEAATLNLTKVPGVPAVDY